MANNNTSTTTDKFPRDRWTYIGGGIAFIIALSISFLGGNIYGSAEAKAMVDALSSSALYYGAAIATSSATILALMLTLVGTTRKVETDFGESFYYRIIRLCFLSTVTLCSALLLLLVLSLPVGEFDKHI